MLVETSYAANGRKSSVAYDHFSLLRTLKDGFGLPCLNQACDATSLIMNDMFGGKQARVGKASSANAVTRFRRAGRRCDRTRVGSRRPPGSRLRCQPRRRGMSDDHHDITVRRQRLVGGQEPQRLGHCLSDQHPVERITMISERQMA